MLKEIRNRFFHPLVEVFRSSIHSRGIRSKKNIKKGTKIGEYTGKKISFEESESLYERMLEKHKKDSSKASVYTFTLDETHDLDGDVWHNILKYVNHSCDPNCETIDDDGVIYLHAIKDIKKGDELFFNYGYDVENYSDHLCYCKSKNCVGYIVAEEQWEELKKLKNE